MKWEYKSVQFRRREFLTGAPDASALTDRLNALGDDGWELVSVTHHGWSAPILAVLKRPK